MAYTFMKAQGGQIGKSLCEEVRLSTALDILNKAAAKGVNIHLPSDSVVADNFAADANTNIAESNQVPDGWMGLDIGPEAISEFSEIIKNYKMIIWNGPMGMFEKPDFAHGTKVVAEAMVASKAKKIIGGGDTITAVDGLGLLGKFDFVSTGGGAMLAFLAGEKLPGLEALGYRN